MRRVLSGNIRRRRKELGLTQSQLAELADISEPYMNDIERCQTWVSDKTLARLSGALGLGLHELFVSAPDPDAAESRADTRLLLQQSKQELHNYIEETFETLLSGMAGDA